MLNRYLDVFKSLEEHEVRYLVIGGIAAVIYGVPRATFDLDLLIAPTMENAESLLNALEEAGLGTASLTTAENVLGQEITVFSDRVRIDVQTRTPGVEFEEAWERRVRQRYGEAMMNLISKNDLIASKSAAGRAIDLQDVASLSDAEP